MIKDAILTLLGYSVCLLLVGTVASFLIQKIIDSPDKRAESDIKRNSDI